MTVQKELINITQGSDLLTYRKHNVLQNLCSNHS